MRGSVIIVAVLCVLAFTGGLVYRDIVKEVPEKYDGDLHALLRDYQRGYVNTEFVLQVLLLHCAEEPGVFLPMSDTDVRYDHYYVSKARRKLIETMKRSYSIMEQKAR